jgi:hypothetical protein
MSEAPKIPAAATTPHSNWKPPAGPYRVFVSTPCDDGHKLCFWDSLRALERASLLGQTKHRYRIHTTPGDSLVPRARNNHAHTFYHDTADDILLSLDSDLDFTVGDIERLLEDPWPIMAGRYAIKQPELRWCLNNLPGQKVDPFTQREFVSTSGTGFLATFRHVFGTLMTEASAWPHWRIRYNDDASKGTVHNLYFNGVVLDPEWFPGFPEGRYLSEDWGFCYLARKHGFPIACDHRVTAFHRGEISYPLNARRLSHEEESAGIIHQPDGSVTKL